MMRLLILNYEYPPLGGGAGPVCRQLCELYVRRGHDVELITMGFRGLSRREISNGVLITRVPAIRRSQATCETHEMISYVASALPVTIWRLLRRNYDVVHCHFVIPTGLLAYLATCVHHIPWVLTAHGSDIPGYNPDRFRREHSVVTPLLRRIMTAASCVTSPSIFLKNLMKEKTGIDCVLHIPNGIDSNRFVPQAKLRRILMTGRLLPRKGFQYILQALDGIETDFEVHIAGDGPMRGELEKLAAKLCVKVVFHGWLGYDSPTLKNLYETSSIFCLPSERENASMSLLEAMVAGMAVITSNASGCPETIGEAGRLVSPCDVEGMRNALRDVLCSEELRKRLIEGARERVLKVFDVESIGSRYLELFEGLRNRPGS